MAKSKERVHIPLSLETTQALLRAKAAQERHNLSNKRMFSKIVGAFAEADEWDVEALEATSDQRRKMASLAYRQDPHGQQWCELADQAAACGQTLEIVTGDVDALRRLTKTLNVPVPELDEYDAERARDAWPKVGRGAVRHAVSKTSEPLDLDAIAG